MSSIALNVHVGTPKRLTQRAQITLQDHGGTTESAMKAAIEYLTWVEWDALQGVDNMARATNNALLGRSSTGSSTRSQLTPHSPRRRQALTAGWTEKMTTRPTSTLTST